MPDVDHGHLGVDLRHIAKRWQYDDPQPSGDDNRREVLAVHHQCGGDHEEHEYKLALAAEDEVSPPQNAENRYF